MGKNALSCDVLKKAAVVIALLLFASDVQRSSAAFNPKLHQESIDATSAAMRVAREGKAAVQASGDPKVSSTCSERVDTAVFYLESAVSLMSGPKKGTLFQQLIDFTVDAGTELRKCGVPLGGGKIYDVVMHAALLSSWATDAIDKERYYSK